ncbi:MAG: hypothetical protein ACRDH6_02830 [Actinomycetota bacterium]
MIADGSLGTVTLRIRGLEGQIIVVPTDPVEYEIRTLTPRVAPGSNPNIYSAGDYTDLDRGSSDFAFLGLWGIGDLYPAAITWGDCFYYHDDLLTPSEESAFMPGCPTGDGVTDVFPGRGVVMTTTNWTCCPKGVGAWYATTTAVRDHGAVGLWLDF